MNVHTCVTDETTYTMLGARSTCLINVECTNVHYNTTYTMVCVKSIYLIKC